MNSPLTKETVDSLLSQYSGFQRVIPYHDHYIVVFDSVDHASQVKSRLDGTTFNGQFLSVSFAQQSDSTDVPPPLSLTSPQTPTQLRTIQSHPTSLRISRTTSSTLSTLNSSSSHSSLQPPSHHNASHPSSPYSQHSISTERFNDDHSLASQRPSSPFVRASSLSPQTVSSHPITPSIHPPSFVQHRTYTSTTPLQETQRAQYHIPVRLFTIPFTILSLLLKFLFHYTNMSFITAGSIVSCSSFSKIDYSFFT